MLTGLAVMQQNSIERREWVKAVSLLTSGISVHQIVSPAAWWWWEGWSTRVILMIATMRIG